MLLKIERNRFNLLGAILRNKKDFVRMRRCVDKKKRSV
jgi:hypothetical protein